MEEQRIPQDKPVGDKKIHKIRTFKDDLANAVRSNGVSSAKIAIKEQQRRQKLEQEEESSKVKPSKIFTLIFSFLFIFISIGIFIVLKFNPELSFLNNKNTTTVTKEPVPMFELSTHVTINPSAGTPIMIEKFNELSKKGTPDKIQVFEFYTESGEIKTIATTSEMFNYMSINQENLEWSIKKMTYGLDGSKPFLLIQMNDFENTFAGMFNWEKNRMINNLESVFPNIREKIIEEEIPNPDFIPQPEEIISEETTVEDGEVVTEEETIPETIIKRTKISWRDNNFVDEILYNKDTRILRNEEGDVGIVYTFIDNNYLLISTEITTIKNVMEIINKYYIANK